MSVQHGAYERAITSGAEEVAAGVQADPDRQVPSCPGWDIGDLAYHVGSLYMRVGEQVRRCSAEPVRSSELPPAPTGRAAGPWVREAADKLLQALAVTQDDAPAGRWRDRSVPAGFWRRRLAHETVVHRVDVDDALGWSADLDGDLTVDGVDEVLELFLPFSISSEAWPPSGELWLVRADGPEQWWIAPRDDGVDARRLSAQGIPPQRTPGEVTRIEAPATELFLLCWGRRVPPGTAVTGEPVSLEQWLGVLGW